MARKPRNPAPAANKDNAEKFKELARARCVRAVKQIRGIGRLSNRRAYESTEAQVKAIFGLLQSELDAAFAKFNAPAAAVGDDVKLDL